MTQNSCCGFQKRNAFFLLDIFVNNLACTRSRGVSCSSFRVTNLHRRKAAILVGRGHAHRRVHGRRRRSRAIRASGRTGVVLRAAPAQTHTGVADGVTLHLVDGHLSGMALNELNEATALSGGDLDVGDLTESLEERPKLILGDIAGKSTNKDSCVVGVSELVHGLRSTVEAHGGSTHGRVHTRGTGHAHTAGNDTRTLVLGSSGGDTHRTVATVDSLHLAQSTLLVVLVGETNEAVATRHAADRVGHDLGRLAGWEAALEEGHEYILVDLRAQITNEDGILRATVITAGKNDCQLCSVVSNPSELLTCGQPGHHQWPSSA